MFYCNSCADMNDWPETGFKSVGCCEICGVKDACNDRPSKLLPIPEILRGREYARKYREKFYKRKTK